MNGIDAYNNNLDKTSKDLVRFNNDIIDLDGFYNYMLIKSSYATAQCYLRYVIGFLKASKIQKVSEINLNTYIKYMASMRNKGSSYRIGIYHGLQKFSKYLKANNYCEDYMQFIERPRFTEKQSTKDKREKGYLEKNEIKVLVDGIYDKECKRHRNPGWDQRDDTIIHLFLNTGIRRAALYKLDIDDVDLEEKTIKVLEKGDKVRVIYISDITVSKIKEWLKFRAQALKGYDENEKALFISRNRCRIHQVSIGKLVSRAAYDIDKDKHISPHKLRATFGTQLYNETGDIYFVQECMGHTDPKTTELYIRGKKGTMSKRASAIMGNIIENNT